VRRYFPNSLQQRIEAIIWTLKCSDGSGFVRVLGAALGDRDGIADQVRRQARLLAAPADPLRQLRCRRYWGIGETADSQDSRGGYAEELDARLASRSRTR
jgi:hypothetical protein